MTLKNCRETYEYWNEKFLNNPYVWGTRAHAAYGKVMYARYIYYLNIYKAMHGMTPDQTFWNSWD